MTWRTRIPLHPVLFAAYAVLFLYAGNLGEVLVVDAAAPVARSMIAAGAVWTLLALVFRDARRGAIVASSIVIAFFGAGHVASAVTVLGLGDHAQLALWGLAVMGAWIYAARARSTLVPVTNGLNVVAVVLVLLSAATIVPYEVARGGGVSSLPVGTVRAATNVSAAPDIYYLVFDRYGSADAIDRRFGLTDNDLYAWLEDRGFQVPAVSRAAYRATDFSLASTLNMRFLDDLTREVGRASSDRTPARQMLQEHEVGRFLKSRGYRYYHIGSWFGPTVSNPMADRSFSLGATSEFEEVLRDTTMLPALDRVLGNGSTEPSFLDRHRESALFQFRQVRRVATAPGPKFVFAHILLPHDPYVFRADGSVLPEAESKAADEADLYAGHLAYVNGRIKEVVEELLAGPEESDPIVILQADEGPLACRSVDCVADTSEYFGVRFGILNAMYLPGFDGVVPSTFTSVNTFRLVFSEYFGADLEPLPDRSFTWPDNDHLYDFSDITDRIPN